MLEVLIAMAIFAMFAASIFFVYGNIIEIISRTRVRTLSSTLLNREIEMVRLLTYDDVGIIGGYPAGVIEQQRVEVYEGVQFLIKAYVRNIDNPFDGTTGGSPNDTAPADYKLVELEVSCALCYGVPPLTYTTWVAPQNLESASNNGSLFVNAFDANGLPIYEADVRVVNASVSPSITIVDQTNASGQLQLVDIPTSTNGYQITVSKQGYSTSVTYLAGATANPNPLQPHATVAAQQITEMSFGIDKVSTLTVRTQDDRCADIGSISMNQTGTKLIGSGPDVVKYSSSFTTNGSGDKTISDLEWDTYRFTNTTSGYDVAGVSPSLPLTINPDTDVDLVFLMEPKSSSSLMVSVHDASGSPIVGASVNLTKTGVDLTKLTGRRSWGETDWSGGNYSDINGSIETSNPAGEMSLNAIGGIYATGTESSLVSNTIDWGTDDISLHELSWLPASQPGSTELKFQIAANNDGSTWNYLGPDGTGNTYFTTTTSTLDGLFDDQQYLRYKVYMSTDNELRTPTLTSVAISFDSSCAPRGNAFFSALATGTYTVTASKTGYTTASSSVSVGSGWQEAVITLSP